MFDDKRAVLCGTLRIVQYRTGQAVDRLFHPLTNRECLVIQRRFHFSGAKRIRADTAECTADASVYFESRNRCQRISRIPSAPHFYACKRLMKIAFFNQKRNEDFSLAQLQPLIKYVVNQIALFPLVSNCHHFAVG